MTLSRTLSSCEASDVTLAPFHSMDQCSLSEGAAYNQSQFVRGGLVCVRVRERTSKKMCYLSHVLTPLNLLTLCLPFFFFFFFWLFFLGFKKRETEVYVGNLPLDVSEVPTL